MNKKLKLIQKSFLTSSFIILILSNTIIGGIYWNNYLFFNDENSQVIGWMTTNIPSGSNIITNEYILYHIDDLIFTNTFYAWSEIDNANKVFNRWDVHNESDFNSFINFFENPDQKNYMLEFNDKNSNGSAGILIEFNYSQNLGFIQFNVKTSDNTKSFWFNFTSQEGIPAINFGIDNKTLSYYNGSTYQKITDILENFWYNIKIYFECSDNNYYGLNQNQWRILINETIVEDYPFLNNVTNLGFFQLYTEKQHFDWSIYLGNFNFSWAPNYNIVYCLFPNLISFNHFYLLSIKYFIYVSNAYYSTESLFLKQYFKEEIYKYGHTTIYYRKEN